MVPAPPPRLSRNGMHVQDVIIDIGDKMWEDYCRCPGCGQCDAAKQRDELAKVLERIVKWRGGRIPNSQEGMWSDARAALKKARK